MLQTLNTLYVYIQKKTQKISCNPPFKYSPSANFSWLTISSTLTVIFSQSLATGKLPDGWLKANITPVLKKGDKSDANNYRPISLTSVCCKILQHIMYHHIVEHLNDNNILINEQFGFRAGHSCEAQLISVVEEIKLAMDRTSQVDIIFIDFRKAFDTVPHCRLLNKFFHY